MKIVFDYALPDFRKSILLALNNDYHIITS